MSSTQPPQPFRFLDLPPEVRHNIYDLALCSWNIEPESEPNYNTKLSRRCLSYQAAALLRANKEINMEASDYMLKHNQFVRVKSNGLDIEKLFCSEGIPVVTTDALKVSQHDGYVMHMTLSRPYSSPKMQSSDSEMIVLQSDMMLFCENLDVETVRVDRKSRRSEYSSIRMDIEFNDALAPFYTPKIQQRLLKPIATHLRGVHGLRILGPVDSDLKQSIIDEVAKPRWTDSNSLLQEIDDTSQLGELQWQQDDYDDAAGSWAQALCTIERVRHSSSWSGLNESGGEEFPKKMANLYYLLNLSYAKFLQVDMVGELVDDSLIQHNGKLAIECLNKCECARSLFAPDIESLWTPSTHQLTTRLFLRARCARLMHDYYNMFQADFWIQAARAHAPNDLAIAREAAAIRNWVWDKEQAWLTWHIRRAEQSCKAMAERAAKMINEAEKLIGVITEYSARSTE